MIKTREVSVAAAKIKILIVDDDRLLAAILQRTLESLGCEVYSAGNGVEAVEMLTKVTVALVMTDVQMPKMDGISLLDAVNRMGLDIPVIIMTGHAEYTEEQVDNRNGAVLLQKPFSRDQLKEIVEVYARALPTR